MGGSGKSLAGGPRIRPRVHRSTFACTTLPGHPSSLRRHRGRGAAACGGRGGGRGAGGARRRQHPAALKEAKQGKVWDEDRRAWIDPPGDALVVDGDEGRAQRAAWRRRQRAVGGGGGGGGGTAEPDFYELLGVEADATAEQIRRNTLCWRAGACVCCGWGLDRWRRRRQSSPAGHGCRALSQASVKNPTAPPPHAASILTRTLMTHRHVGAGCCAALPPCSARPARRTAAAVATRLPCLRASPCWGQALTGLQPLPCHTCRPNKSSSSWEKRTKCWHRRS